MLFRPRSPYFGTALGRDLHILSLNAKTGLPVWPFPPGHSIGHLGRVPSHHMGTDHPLKRQKGEPLPPERSLALQGRVGGKSLPLLKGDPGTFKLLFSYMFLPPSIEHMKKGKSDHQTLQTIPSGLLPKPRSSQVTPTHLSVQTVPRHQ